MRSGGLTVDLEREALRIFAEALDREPPEREQWLAVRCGAGTALLAKVERLLAADSSEAEVFASPDAGPDPTAHPDATGGSGASGEWRFRPPLPPPQVGPYRLEELIGAGGMGSVYRARRNDGLFEQAVAIKFIRPLRGGLEVKPLIDAERRLLARMEHPAIARILDGGTTDDGLHFLVMELVRGTALDEHARARGLGVAARVSLFREVCAAVGHAHQHLVVHCDLKPANILVTDDGRPKLIDFGVAHLEDAVDATRPTGFTRVYTSPERQGGAPPALSDDVYSLGVVLRELLSGEEPGSELGAGSDMPRELSAIAGKAMAPTRDARYASVAALDADLLAWLEHRPVEAAGGSAAYRARKLVERHPWRAGGAVVALTGLVVASIVTGALYARAERARRDAENRFQDVRALATYMLFELDEQLESTPGTTLARREMVGRGQQYLDSLARTAGDDPELRREVALGLARLAEVQGVPGKPHVGEPAAARQNLQRAVGLLAALVAERPREWAWLADLARVRYLLALLLAARENDPHGELAEARQAEADLTHALDGWAASGATPPAIGTQEALLTSIRLTQADALKSLADHAGAAALAEREEKRLAELPAERRTGMDFEYQSGRPAILLGDALYFLDRFEEACDAYRRGIARFEKGLARAPLDRHLLEGLLVGHWSLAGTLAELGRHEESLPAIDRAVALGEQLVRLDPENLEAIRLRDIALGQRALAVDHLGRHDEAIAITEAGVAAKRARAAASPDDAERVRDAVVPLVTLADFYRNKGDAVGACRVLREAEAGWSEIERRWGMSDLDRRRDVDAVRARLAECAG